MVEASALGGRTRAAAFEVDGVNADPREDTSERGLRLGLLVLVSILLCGSMWALLRLTDQMPLMADHHGGASHMVAPPPGPLPPPGTVHNAPPPGPLPTSQPAAPPPGPFPTSQPIVPPPGPLAPTPLVMTATPGPLPATPSPIIVTENMDFRRLMLVDMIIGILDMEAEAPAPLRLTSVQKGILRDLEPQIATRFRTNDRTPGPLDDAVRKCLTSEQKSWLLGTFQKKTPPRDLSPYTDRLHSLLSGG